MTKRPRTQKPQGNRYLRGMHSIIGFDIADRLGFRLRMLREMMGMSRPVFADAVGIPPTTLKNYELGYRQLDLNTVLFMHWGPELNMRALTKALFLDIPPVVCIRGEEGPRYSFINTRMDTLSRAAMVTMLRNSALECAAANGITVPDGYAERWTDHGIC